MKTSIPFDKQIEEIMDEFDFEKVHKAMKSLNWKWFDADEGVPRIGELRRVARRLLEAVITHEGYNATGGFVARHDKWDRLCLEFVLTGWEIYDPLLDE